MDRTLSPAAVEEILEGLSPAQHRAVTTPGAPLCVLAAAGAGKTRVLAHRIAYRAQVGSADPGRVLALTFTRKAAGEMRDRLRQLGLRDQVTAGTFHAVAGAQLRRWWADRGQQAPVLLERKVRLLGPLVSARPALAGVPLAEVAAQVEWAQACMIGPDRFEEAAADAGRALPAQAGEIAALIDRYRHEKARRGLIDFDDLLEGCARAIETDHRFAGAQRWRWRHVFVDEFQDVNPLQHRLLLAWLGTSEDLCVVGDPNQAIYRWNGADPGLLDALPSRWPRTEVLHLDDNHRCSPQVVRAAAAVLGARGTRLGSARPDGPEPELHPFPSDDAEASGIATQVRAAHAGGLPWSQAAVLTRTNAQLVAIQGALVAAGVPARVAGGRPLVDSPDARHLLAELGRRTAQPLQMVIADLERPGPDQDASEVGLALAGLAREYQHLDPEGDLSRWLAWLPSAVPDDRGGPSVPAVTLCSFHRAKGLEWAAVWVAGLEEGLVPIGRATSTAALEEEQRLLYVALTRAGRELRCSWAERRSFGGRPVPRQPSRWWAPLVASTARPHDLAPAPAATWQHHIDEQRRRLRAVPTGRTSTPLPAGWPEPDPGLTGALRAWRADAARASGVPAHVILHDMTLVAVASLRPRTGEDLLAVPGLGPVKAARYGPALLDLVAGAGADDLGSGAERPVPEGYAAWM